MSKVIVDFSTNTYYNINFDVIKSLLTIPLESTAWGFSGQTSMFSLILRHDGGIKIKISFTSHEEFVSKFNASILALSPLVEYYRNEFHVDLLKRMSLLWSDDYAPHNKKWTLANATYKETVVQSDYGYKHSEFVQV